MDELYCLLLAKVSRSLASHSGLTRYDNKSNSKFTLPMGLLLADSSTADHSLMQLRPPLIRSLCNTPTSPRYEAVVNVIIGSDCCGYQPRRTRCWCNIHGQCLPPPQPPTHTYTPCSLGEIPGVRKPMLR